MLTDKFRQRVIHEAKLIVNEDMTIRQVAAALNTGRNAVWNHVHTILPKINRGLYVDTQDVLDRHKDEALTRATAARQQKRRERLFE